MGLFSWFFDDLKPTSQKPSILVYNSPIGSFSIAYQDQNNVHVLRMACASAGNVIDRQNITIEKLEEEIKQLKERYEIAPSMSGICTHNIYEALSDEDKQRLMDFIENNRNKNADPS
jgi:hypothetical protein